MPPNMRPKNPLLVRDEVGKAKATCYDLPPEHKPFGSAGKKDPEGAREVTMTWVGHSPRVRREEKTPDFKAFNKQALKNRMCTAKDQGRFIREVAVLPECSPRTCASNRGSPRQLPSETTPGWSYGRKVRPSTPIDQVLAHRWGTEGEEELQNFYTAELIAKASPAQARKIIHTTASKGHASRARASNELPLESKELFKLSKYKNVPKRLNTFRDQPLRNSDDDMDDDLNKSAPLSPGAVKPSHVHM